LCNIQRCAIKLTAEWNLSYSEDGFFLINAAQCKIQIFSFFLFLTSVNYMDPRYSQQQTAPDAYNAFLYGKYEPLMVVFMKWSERIVKVSFVVFVNLANFA
jgi:hypothetical protein